MICSRCGITIILSSFPCNAHHWFFPFLFIFHFLSTIILRSNAKINDLRRASIFQNIEFVNRERSCNFQIVQNVPIPQHDNFNDPPLLHGPMFLRIRMQQPYLGPHVSPFRPCCEFGKVATFPDCRQAARRPRFHDRHVGKFHRRYNVVQLESSYALLLLDDSRAARVSTLFDADGRPQERVRHVTSSYSFRHGFRAGAILWSFLVVATDVGSRFLCLNLFLLSSI
mmetsp:Transcript_25290/g.52895  ORF Transcript_25290/g.52895 Transcript_25290/m.52895 type:complete len:226 (+) Transcript_25290:508-1185(+)